MKLQQNARLALYAVLDFAAEPSRQLTAGEIAAKYKVSTHHLAKVLGRLGSAGLLRAARGVGGGYRFAANARRVTLLDVIGLFEQIGAARARGARRAEERALEEVLAEIDDIARATFGSITLATMLKLVGRRAQRPSGAPGRAG